MKRSQNVVMRTIQIAGLAMSLICVGPSLSSAGLPPVVHVEIETENHVLPVPTKKDIFYKLRLTYTMPPSRGEQPVSILINPGVIDEGAGLVVEHIAPDGTKSKQSRPTAPWWFSKSEVLEVKSTTVPTSYSIWVRPMGLDFSKLVLYRISYVHPRPVPSTEPNSPIFTSNTLTIACVTQERFDQLHRMLRQNQQLAFAAYRLKNPPCVEHPKYRRSGLDEIATALRNGARQDEVLLLLGSPDWASYASPGVRTTYGWDETWAYETSPVGEFCVCFKDGRVVRAANYGARPEPPRQ